MQKFWRRGRKHFAIHKLYISEKYSMQRAGSSVILVKTEVEENKAGQKVNKLFDFDYPLQNLYFEDNLEEYIEGLRQRFSKHDPETEMERVKNKTEAHKSASLETKGQKYGEQASLLSVASTLSYMARLICTLDRFVVRHQGELEHGLQNNYMKNVDFLRVCNFRKLRIFTAVCHCFCMLTLIYWCLKSTSKMFLNGDLLGPKQIQVHLSRN